MSINAPTPPPADCREPPSPPPPPPAPPSAAHRQAAALERIAQALETLIGQAQFVHGDEQPADPLRTTDSEPRQVSVPRVL